MISETTQSSALESLLSLIKITSTNPTNIIGTRAFRYASIAAYPSPEERRDVNNILRFLATNQPNLSEKVQKSISLARGIRRGRLTPII